MAIRIIQVGMGSWGRDWAKNVPPQVEEVEAVAWVDSDPQSLEVVQATLGIPPERCFTCVDAAFSAVEADAVLATVSLPAHVPVALAALEAGKHVLLEKPFAPTLAGAQQVVDLAAARGRVMMISQNYRFFPAAQMAARLVREGELGPVGAVNIDFRRNMPTVLRDNHPYLIQEHPLLMDMAIHHFDLMRAVLGQEPVSVACQAWNPPWRAVSGFLSGTATITFDGGAVVNYRGSWTSPGPKTVWAGEWRMECERGEIVWTSRGDDRLAAERVTVCPLDGPARELDLPTPRYFDRAGALAAFVAAIRTGTEPPCSGRDNLGSVALMTTAVAAAGVGQTLPVPTVAIRSGWIQPCDPAGAVGGVGRVHRAPWPPHGLARWDDSLGLGRHVLDAPETAV